MIFPIIAAVIIGLPALVLAVWFSWLGRRCWLSGGPTLVTGMWLLHLALISTICGTITYPFLFVAPNDYLDAVLRNIAVYGIAGSLPSGVIACVVSWLAHLFPNRAILTLFAGTLAGLAAGVVWLPVAFAAETALRRI